MYLALQLFLLLQQLLVALEVPHRLVCLVLQGLVEHVTDLLGRPDAMHDLLSVAGMTRKSNQCVKTFQLQALIKIHKQVCIEREENCTIQYQTKTDTMLPVELGIRFLHSVILLVSAHLFKYYGKEYIMQLCFSYSVFNL